MFNEVLIFRNKMAEQGREYTPDEALRIAQWSDQLRMEVYRRSLEDPEYFEKLASLTLPEKQMICAEFEKKGLEVTVSELEGLLELVMEIHEVEKFC